MSVTITPHYEHELVNQELGELPLDDQYIEHGISDIEEYLAGHVSEQLDPNDVRQEVSEAYAGIVASREAEDAGNMQREIAKAT
ncbi:MAG: hypothetical protein R3313_04575, partial [Candidatus Saccharimonadales bacterium]|nr:hypothetical protein [Candidatus Saccharimonadales bacterium]